MLNYRGFKKNYRTLFIYRLRTFLSVLGILFGVASIITMLSIGEGAKQEVLEQIEQLGIHTLTIRQVSSGKNSSLSSSEDIKKLSADDISTLRENIPSLKYIAPLKVIQASLKNSFSSLSPEILAVSRQYGEMKNLQPLEGRFLCDSDLQYHHRVCVLGYEVAKSLGIKGHLNQTLKIENKNYQVIGILKPTFWKAGKTQVLSTRNLDKTIFIPLDSSAYLPFKEAVRDDSLSEIILQFEKTSPLKTNVALVSFLLKKIHGDHENYQLVVPQELFDQALRTQTTFNWVLGSIAAISLLIGGIGIMNIMLATVSERTHEIGIRRALGANQQHILMQFLSETLVLTLLGACLGIFLGIGSSVFIHLIAGWKTIITFSSLVLSLLMSCLVGIGSGLYPALQAAKMNPIDALRH